MTIPKSISERPDSLAAERVLRKHMIRPNIEPNCAPRDSNQIDKIIREVRAENVRSRSRT